jgi:hypothetical protein
MRNGEDMRDLVLPGCFAGSIVKNYLGDEDCAVQKTVHAPDIFHHTPIGAGCLLSVGSGRF